MATLETLPLDLFTDSLLPFFSPSSLARLAATNRAFHDLIQGAPGEVVWAALIAKDYNFPVHNTGRRSGWRELYRRLAASTNCFVWGTESNGRLAIADDDYSTREQLHNGGLTTPHRLHLSHNLVGLEAGGWSFHGLTFEGMVLSWGTMNPERWRSGTLSNPGYQLSTPIILPASEAIGEVVQLEAGRKHVVLRNKRGEVWEYRSFGRAYRVMDAAQWGVGIKGKAVVAVEAGWEHSAALTQDGSVYIWWEFGTGLIDREATAAGEENLPEATRDSPPRGITFTLETETLKLPDIPSLSSSPRDEVKVIASGDHSVYTLTHQSRIYRLDISPVGRDPPNLPRDPEDSPTRSRGSRERLSMAFISGERRWEYLPKFCQVDELIKLNTNFELPPTHISAHFHSFVAYSVPNSASDSTKSMVLLGTDELSSSSAPQILEVLQGKSVIKVSFGDYHNLALTSAGQVFSWGSFSSGALGLGHPDLPNTPLYHTESTPDPPAPAHGSTTVPLIRHNNAARLQRSLPPGKVETPTLIRFTGDSVDVTEGEENANERKNRKFAFHVTAAGHHSGALAIELGTEDTEELEKNLRAESGVEGPSRVVGKGRGEFPVFRGIRGYRIGYPGRGLRRAGFPGAGGSDST